MNNPKTQNPKAFTLLEMVITMMIISIVMGSAFFVFSTDTSNPLKKLTPEIEHLSTSAVRTAVSDNKSQYIILTTSKIILTDLPQLPTEDIPQIVTRSISIPNGVSISFNKSNDDDWTTITDRSDPIIWIISRSGISENISLRLNFEDSVYEMKFDPLTGNLDESDENLED